MNNKFEFPVEYKYELSRTKKMLNTDPHFCNCKVLNCGICDTIINDICFIESLLHNINKQLEENKNDK